MINQLIAKTTQQEIAKKNWMIFSLNPIINQEIKQLWESQ